MRNIKSSHTDKRKDETTPLLEEAHDNVAASLESVAPLDRWVLRPVIMST